MELKKLKDVKELKDLISKGKDVEVSVGGKLGKAMVDAIRGQNEFRQKVVITTGMIVAIGAIVVSLAVIASFTACLIYAEKQGYNIDAKLDAKHGKIKFNFVKES